MNKALKTSNNQHPTPNIQWSVARDNSALDVGCWMLVVSLSFPA
jgi:hypothetical protein